MGTTCTAGGGHRRPVLRNPRRAAAFGCAPVGASKTPGGKAAMAEGKRTRESEAWRRGPVGRTRKRSTSKNARLLARSGRSACDRLHLAFQVERGPPWSTVLGQQMAVSPPLLQSTTMWGTASWSLSLSSTPYTNCSFSLSLLLTKLCSTTAWWYVHED
jgi:hypothetical protein